MTRAWAYGNEPKVKATKRPKEWGWYAFVCVYLIIGAGLLWLVDSVMYA